MLAKWTQEKEQIISTCLCEPRFILLEMGKLGDSNGDPNILKSVAQGNRLKSRLSSEFPAQCWELWHINQWTGVLKKPGAYQEIENRTSGEDKGPEMGEGGTPGVSQEPTKRGH